MYRDQHMKKITGILLCTFVSLLLFSGCLVANSAGREIAAGIAVDRGPWMVLGEDPETQRIFLWTAAETAQEVNLFFGESPEALESIAVESVGNLHRARLVDLLPETTYYYSIDGKTIREFTTFDGNPGIDFCVFGDMQLTNRVSKLGNEVMASALARIEVDLFLQLGDLVEIGGNMRNWYSALQYIEQFAGRTPIATAVGNHDYYGDRKLSNYRSLFPNPFAAKTGAYYSFNLKDVHFLFLDTFDGKDFAISDEQKSWAETDLQAAADGEASWIFIFFHDTMLTTGTSVQNWRLQRWLIPLADKYGVAAIFFAHDHHYEHWLYEYGRNNLLYNREDEPSGKSIHIFCSGGGGAQSEVHYGLFNHRTWTTHRQWYNRLSGKMVTVTTKRGTWNRELFIDHIDDPLFGHPRDGKQYYHLPSINSYSTDNEHFGYGYGEQTLHYLLVKIPDDAPNTCIISAHYPNGELITGPDGSQVQRWVLQRPTP